jgi:hypothetical protein
VQRGNEGGDQHGAPGESVNNETGHGCAPAWKVADGLVSGGITAQTGVAPGFGLVDVDQCFAAVLRDQFLNRFCEEDRGGGGDIQAVADVLGAKLQDTFPWLDGLDDPPESGQPVARAPLDKGVNAIFESFKLADECKHGVYRSSLEG